MTTSKSGVTRYMAPELLNPPQFGLTHSDPSKDSDVYSFAMTVYEVFPSHLVARIANERLILTTRYFQGPRHIVVERRDRWP